MHWLLEKQLDKLGIESPETLDPDDLVRLLAKVSETYEQADRERYLLERSLAISSEEMRGLYGKLVETSEAQIRLERDRLRVLIDAFQLSYIVLTPEGVIDTANPEALSTTGYSEAEAIGSFFTDVLVAGRSSEEKNTREKLLQILESQSDPDLRMAQFVRKDGNPYTAAFVISPLWKAELPQGFLLAFRDITILRRAEERIRRSERLYRTIARIFPNGSLFLFDTSLRFTLADGAGLRLDGRTKETIEGKTLKEAFGNQVAEVMEPLYRGALNGQAAATEVAFGNRVYLVHIVPVRDDDGEVYAGMVMTQDVTDAKRSESELIAAKERAEEVSRLKTSLIRNITHEVRTPLASILGFASILVQETEGEAREFAELIHKSGARLEDTLRSVLEIGQLEAGRTQLDIRRFDVCELLEDEAEILMPMAAARGLALSLEIRSRPLWCMSDRSSISRVIRNLVENAAKFTDDGGITIRAGQRSGNVEIQVEDTGIGIGPEFLPHVFDEFSQASTGLGRTHEGVGLGLAITKKLIDMMGGTVAVSSQIGSGTCFTVELPDVMSPPSKPYRRKREGRRQSKSGTSLG